mgnify:CR=1 FL=1
MIITKTPYRISFFGGGSDYPEWYKEYGGKVLSTTIDKYIYISCRFLPKFFKHKYRIVWSKIENVKDVNQIQHKVVKKLLQHLKVKQGLEIHYDGDLPARSGMGSSSCFTVGLTKALYKIKNKNLTKIQLTKKTIEFEQKIMKEVVGSQDQTIASYGGFNKIIFNKNSKIQVQRLSCNKNIEKLNKNLVLIYTGINRTAHKIANSYVRKLTKSKKNHIENIMSYVNEGKTILESGNVDDFGKLLHTSWLEKKNLSSLITNNKIDQLYEETLRYGALGGKLLGAGGGGFLLVYMKKENAKKFFKRYKNVINVPFNFTKDGSQVILNNL